MERAAESRHALGTESAGQDRVSRAATLDWGEAPAERDPDVVRARDELELSAAVALVARGTSRWVMVCGLHDTDALLEDSASSAAAVHVELRRTAPDTILVTGVGAPAGMGRRAGSTPGRGLIHAALAVAGRLIGE